MAKKIYDANREIESFRTNDGDTEEVLLSTRERMLREGGGDVQSLADRVDILEQTLDTLFYHGILGVDYGGTGQSGLSNAFASMVSNANNKATPALTDYAMISDGDGTAAANKTGKIQLSDLQTLIAGGALQASNNLDDVANKSTSFSNLMKGATSPSADEYDSFVVVATAGDAHYAGIRTRGNIADDLASVGGLMKGSNNLSDLTDVDTAVENLVSGTAVDLSLVTENSRIPFKSSVSTTGSKGYVLLSSIWSWIKSKIASVLGLEENSGTKTYSGTAAKATTALNLQIAAPGNNYKIESLISAQQSISGDGTVTFSSSDDLPLDAVVLGARAIGDSASGVDITSITSYRTKSTQTTSLTVTVNVTADAIGMGNPSVFNIELFILTKVV